MSKRIGIAGCGSHAMNRILPLLTANSGLELAAVWTRNEKTQALLRERGVPNVCGDFAQFLAMDMDLVYIATPTGCHFEHAAAVLRSGRHAWVEKPLACTLGEARELVALAERKALMLGEAFMFPWHAQAEAIRQALRGELPGEPRLVSLTFCFPHLQPDNFRYDPKLGGGAWLDHACYLVKALDCYFPGEWSLLGGCLEHDAYEVDVRGAAQLRRADGLIANLNWGFGHAYVNELQVIGTRGRMLAESAFTKPATRSCDITLEDGKGQRSTLTISPENPFAKMLEGFAHALEQSSAWAPLRHDILAHAERFFALQTLLQKQEQQNPQVRHHAE